MSKLTCPVCGTLFTPAYPWQKYCSPDCKVKAVNAHSHDEHRYSGNREIVLKRDGYKCTVCGSTERLSVHHKDHSGQEVTRNDDPENLIALCSACHEKYHAPLAWQTSRFKERVPSTVAKCQVCGKEFRVKKWHLEHGRGMYCSIECRAKAVHERKSVKRTCLHCGKEFTIWATRANRGPGAGQFCSLECRKSAGYVTRKRTETETKTA